MRLNYWGGLSPRVRGNHCRNLLQRQAQRSIPACAGEPWTLPALCRRLRVYPRVCGGTRNRGAVESLAVGLSPRVRGNRLHRQGRAGRDGSIPACAGEPMSLLAPTRATTVYPRVCGGTSCAILAYGASHGLSPRVRGNLRAALESCPVSGSIPACAGEPGRQRPRPARRTVYPRVCGGTSVGVQSVMAVPGLSPRVRGNLHRCAFACGGAIARHVCR